MIRLLRSLLAVTTLTGLLLAGALVDAAGADAGMEADFVARVNGARSAKGLGTLTTDGELTAIARRWSQRMADANKLSHNPNLANEVTQNWEKLAENVGVGPTVEDIHNAFMNSAPHRANILDGALTHIGVGVVIDGSGAIWVTQVFMRLRSGGSASSPTTAAPAPAPAPSPAPTTAPTTTTTRPRLTTTTAAPAPATATPAPRAVPTTTSTTTAVATTAPPLPPPPPEPTPTAPSTSAGPPTSRLVLVLDGLRALDRGQ